MDPYAQVPEIRRLRWLTRFAFLWALIIFARLVHLQVLRHEELTKLAESQHEKGLEVRAPKGTLFDSRGEPLAMSVPVLSLAVNPVKMKNPGQAAALLAGVLKADRKEILSAILEARSRKRGRGFLWIKRKLEPEEVEELKKNKQEWMDFREESRRVYPMGSVGAPLLGFVNHAEQGASGAELSFSRHLEGTPGHVRVLTDVRQRGIEALETIPPKPGRSIGLTIDSRLQYMSDRELAKAVQEANGESGTLVTVEAGTGRVLAMSSYPGFDPNEPPQGSHDMANRTNRAITFANDPGSVFKMFIIAAALEKTRLRADSMINCGNGIFLFGGGQRIRDEHSYSVLRLEEVLWKSSNIGAIHIGIELGRENMFEYLRLFGFHRPTGLGLPGEAPGLMRDFADWTKGSHYYLSIGHEIGVTTAQLAQAASVFANKGMLVPLRIVDWREDEKGVRVPEPTREPRRVLKAETALEMLHMSEGVVLSGTGKRAKMAEFRSGGKTGTAQMYDPIQKAYVPRYNSTFLGFAPLSAPRVITVVTINGTRMFGGVASAPVFKTVTESAMSLFGVESDVPPEEVAEDAKKAPTPPALIASAKPAATSPAEEPVRTRELITGPRIPDFSGMTKQQVLMASARLGMPVDVVGRGLARNQKPAAGAALVEGERVRVYFAR